MTDKHQRGRPKSDRQAKTPTGYVLTFNCKAPERPINGAEKRGVRQVVNQELVGQRAHAFVAAASRTRTHKSRLVSNGLSMSALPPKAEPLPQSLNVR